jgi:hypothetical protein
MSAENSEFIFVLLRVGIKTGADGEADNIALLSEATYSLPLVKLRCPTTVLHPG